MKKIPMSSAIVAAATFLVFLAVPAQASVLFEDVRDFQTSGPVALQLGQTASVCAVNVEESPLSILIGLLQADNPSLLAVQRVTVAPGAETCVRFTRQQPPNPQLSGNVVGFVVPQGRVIGQDVIVQDRPGGGGCIAASVQIQLGAQGQAFLYVPMNEHHDSPAQREPRQPHE